MKQLPYRDGYRTCTACETEYATVDRLYCRCCSDAVSTVHAALESRCRRAIAARDAKAASVLLGAMRLALPVETEHG